MQVGAYASGLRNGRSVLGRLLGDSAAGELPNDVGGVNGDWLYLSVAHQEGDA
jgi:hypothetical protein